MKIAHVTSGVVRLLFVIVTAQPPLPAARPTVPRLFPVVTQKLTAPAVGGVVHAVVALYLTESAKYASSAVTRFRRSDFIEAMYAFCFVLANFGIAMAARIPMMTTTISSSISVKPLRFMFAAPQDGSRARLAICLDEWHCAYPQPRGVVNSRLAQHLAEFVTCDVK